MAPDPILLRSSAVRLSGIQKSFGRRVVFKGLDLRIEPGEFVSVVGPSGCGKSTLLRLIAGLEAPDSGQVELEGGREKGFVFQDAHLLPWRTVLENVLLPLELRAAAPMERVHRAAIALRQAGMAAESGLYPDQLSGGMKMRVSLARALVLEPALLLLDEPFAALDELSRLQLEEDLREWWKATRVTTVLVTHSFSEAVFLSDRIFILSTERQGLGEVFSVDFKDRNAALRSDAQFVQRVQECRSRFESLQEKHP